MIPPVSSSAACLFLCSNWLTYMKYTCKLKLLTSLCSLLAQFISLMLYVDGSRSPHASPQCTAGTLGKFPFILWGTTGNLLINPLSKTSSVTLFNSLLLQWHNYRHYISHLTTLHQPCFGVCLELRVKGTGFWLSRTWAEIPKPRGCFLWL